MCEEGCSGDDPGGLTADDAKEPGDEGLEHSGIGHGAEEKDGKDKHADDSGNAIDSGEHEFARAQTEAAEEGGEDGDSDERDDGGDPLAEDCGHESEDREDAE